MQIYILALSSAKNTLKIIRVDTNHQERNILN
jgi:hypothetical protein